MDTRDKRASALACGLAFLAVLPVPDGLAFDQGDRQQVAAVYRGITAGVPTGPTPRVITIDAGTISAVNVDAGYALIGVDAGYALIGVDAGVET